ncbi:MAG: hypothetical protein IPJ34_13870 [Myxococcales bacterium]|nr:hypothetical protein [Myxococcales bacterium]
MADIDRRGFLGAGVGSVVAGCAAGVRPPKSVEISQAAEDVLARLDRALLVGEAKKHPLAQFDKGGTLHEDERYVRAVMRSLTVVGVLQEVPVEVQTHPAIQRRLWDSMADMDFAVGESRRRLAALTPADHRNIRELLSKPGVEVGDEIFASLDRDAAAAGMSTARRLHLRSLGREVTGRLRQSPQMFADEMLTKLDRAIAAAADPVAWTELRMGKAAYAELTEKVAVGQAAFGTKKLAAAVSSSALTPAELARIQSHSMLDVPTSPPSLEPPKKKSKTTVLQVGGYMLGIGVVVTALGGVIVAAGPVIGLFVMTLGVLGLLGGLVVTLVGAIISAS